MFFNNIYQINNMNIKQLRRQHFVFMFKEMVFFILFTSHVNDLTVKHTESCPLPFNSMLFFFLFCFVFFVFFKLYCTPLLHASGSGLGTGRPMSKHYLLLYSHTRKDRVRERERVRERRKRKKKKKRIVRDKIC